MKATGIVRRIDDLGRVVIPKEIRRTLRIREGDPLEIFTDKDGVVIFKKYSLLGDQGEFAMDICDALNKTTRLTAAVTDRDTVIAASGGLKRDILEKSLSEKLESLMESRQIYKKQNGDGGMSLCAENESCLLLCACPILCSGDILGSVALLGDASAALGGETEAKLCQAMAGVLGRHMEA